MKNGQKLQKITISDQKWPKKDEKLPKMTTNYQEIPKMTKKYQKLWKMMKNDIIGNFW